ncbi:MAG: transposase, partial [Deltaproteobacteria bacterium]|nr:transposase [Deltaproteobacteria bacterium]
KDLFSAYNDSELPMEGGYIISSFFDQKSNYTRYEVIAYNNVKDIYHVDEGIVFKADGKKIFILVEPVSFSRKQTEPCYRDDAHKIPYRFKELDEFRTKRQDRVYIAKEPVETYTSFTVLNETGLNNSYVCYPSDDVHNLIDKFFQQALYQNSNVPRSDAKKICAIIIE